MFTVLVYHGCCLALSVSSYLFSFFTSLYQPNLDHLNSISAPKHLSAPYLWIMERFSGIHSFIESTPLRFTQSPFLLHCSISRTSSSLNAHSKYIPHTRWAHIQEYMHARIPALFKPFPLPQLLRFLPSFLPSLPPFFPSTSPHSLFPLRSLSLRCSCHQLRLAGSQAAQGFAPLAFPLWHGTTGHAVWHTGQMFGHTISFSAEDTNKMC